MNADKTIILAEIKRLREKKRASKDNLEKLLIETHELVPLYVALGNMVADEVESEK